MAQTYSRLRQQAEIAFKQTQITAGRIVDQFLKDDTDAERLRAKTARLRDARLCRDNGDTGQSAF